MPSSTLHRASRYSRRRVLTRAKALQPRYFLYYPPNLAEDTARPIFLTFGLGQSSSLVHFFPVMGFLNVEIRWKAASFGRVLKDLDNLIEQVCPGAQIAGGGILASNDRAFLQVGAYRVTLIRGFSTLLHLHEFGFRIRAVSFGSLLADRSACLRPTSQG